MSVRYVVSTSMSAYESLGINSEEKIRKGNLLLHTLCCPALQDINQKCIGVCICLCHPTRKKNKCKAFDIENIDGNIIKNPHGYIVLTKDLSLTKYIFKYENQIETLTVNEDEFVTFWADFTSIIENNYIESFYVTAKDYLDKNAPEIIESSRIADDINNNYIEVVINDETKNNKSPYTLDVYITDSVLENYSIRVWLYVLKV